MARSFIPYGQLQNGNYGVLLDPATQEPLASAIEVLNSLPSAASADNFNGRMVYELTTDTLYVYSSTLVAWKALEGVPATVGSASGNPPVVPAPQSGELFYDLDTEVMFVWSGANWVPIGGRYAAQVVENTYIGNGVLTNFASGSSDPIASQYVEVFIDGVRQVSGVDYNVVGTLIVFTVAPPNGTNVYVRSLISDAIVNNSQVTGAVTTAAGGQTTFSTGIAGADPAGVFVYVDGVLKSGGGVDYTLQQQNTTITNATKTAPTILRLTTASPHRIPVGGTVTFAGFAEPDYDSGVYTVTSVPSPTQFTVTVLPTDPASGSGDPVMFFNPPYENDTVVFNSGLSAGRIVDIRVLKSVVVSGNVGETNTLASAGTGTGLVTTKIGETLQVKSLVSGTNVTLTDLGNEIQFDATTGAGFEDRAGINATNYSVADADVTSYIGVRNTSSPVTINLGSILQNTSNSGRRITIKDESLGAGVNSIQIAATPALIDGSAAPYVINNNGGSVTLVMDGNDWYIVSAYP